MNPFHMLKLLAMDDRDRVTEAREKSQKPCAMPPRVQQIVDLEKESQRWNDITDVKAIRGQSERATVYYSSRRNGSKVTK